MKFLKSLQMKNKKLINRIFQRENIYFHLTIPLLTLLLLRVVIGDTDSLIFTIFLIIAIPWFFVSAIFWIFSFLGKGDIRVNDIDGKVDKQRVSIIQFHNDALRFVFIISVIVGLFVLDFTEGKNLSSVSLSSNFGQLFGFSLFFVFIYFIGRWELKKNQKDRNRIRRGVIVWAILLISISLSLFSEKTKTAQLQETALWQNPLIGRRNIGDIEGSRVVITEKEKIEIERNRIELEKIKKVAKERLQEQKQIYLQTNKSANYSEQIDDLYRNTKYNFRMKFPQGWDIKSNDSINSILQKEVPNIVYQADNDNYYGS